MPAGGALLDACDVHGVWYEAQIADVDEASESVLVHFTQWSAKYDVWLPAGSPLLATHGARTYQGASRGPLRAGHRLDFFTVGGGGGGGGGGAGGSGAGGAGGAWHEAKVVEERADAVLVRLLRAAPAGTPGEWLPRADAAER